MEYEVWLESNIIGDILWMRKQGKMSGIILTGKTEGKDLREREVSLDK